MHVDRTDMLELVVDVWRAKQRADRDSSTPASVRLACENAVDRLMQLGFRIDDLVGKPYHHNEKAKVVHKEGGTANPRVSQCFSPAVYFEGKLVKKAEIAVRGEQENDQNDS